MASKLFSALLVAALLGSLPGTLCYAQSKTIKLNDGFKFQRDVFRNTRQGKYAKGKRGSKALVVKLGGVDNNFIKGMSGGWGRDFFLPNPSSVQLVFDLRMSLFSYLRDINFLDAMVKIDGKDVGLSPGTDYIVRMKGQNQRPHGYYGFRRVSVNLGYLSAGRHRIIIGGFMRGKDDSKQEIGTIKI